MCDPEVLFRFTPMIIFDRSFVGICQIQIINLDDNLFDEVTAHQSADFWNFWIDNRVLYMSAEEILQMHAWFLNVRWILSSTEELQMRDFMLRNQLSTLFTGIEVCCQDYMKEYHSKTDNNAHRILQRFGDYWLIIVSMNMKCVSMPKN